MPYLELSIKEILDGSHLHISNKGEDFWVRHLGVISI